MGKLTKDQDPREPEARLRRREPGEPPLPLLRARGRHRGLSGDRRPVPRHLGGRDRPRLRPHGLPEGRSATPPPTWPFGNTRQNLQSAIEGETYEYTQMYPGMARTAREEGFPEIAEWFETLAKAERSPRRPLHKGPRGPGQAELDSLAFDPRDPGFFDPPAVEKELRARHRDLRRLPALLPPVPVLRLHARAGGRARRRRREGHDRRLPARSSTSAGSASSASTTAPTRRRTAGTSTSRG